MFARWSLRSKLVAVIALALVPVVCLSVWQAAALREAAAARQVSALAAAADMAAARFDAQVTSATSLLTAVCADDVVRASILPDAQAGVVAQCEAYIGRTLADRQGNYSALVVTDEAGVGRCANKPAALGMSFADRDVFRMVRDGASPAVGPKLGSRIEPITVIPVGVAVREAGAFRGMCLLGIPLKGLSEGAALSIAGVDIGFAIVERTGVVIGGDPASMGRLPVAARLGAAIVGDQPDFEEYGQDGALYAYHLKAISSRDLFVVTLLPASPGMAATAQSYIPLVMIGLAVAIVLLASWLGADRWCVKPLRYIQDFADKVARGEDIRLEQNRHWAPELASVGAGVTAMAEAIASREAELRAGLEQRDHMLREIHHRVKNNLQMISSLLNLQAGEIRSPRIRRFFGDAQNRVLTLSILHRHLYERSSWSLVDFQQFISDLVRQISVGRGNAGRPIPRYHIRAPIMAVGPDTAIPIGLIVTEAVGIALGHSFACVTTPEIRIEAKEADGQVELAIEDNGVAGDTGMLGPDGRGGFGLTLIRGLAMQLGGEAEVSTQPGGGTRVVVTFPSPSGDEAADG